MGCGSIGAEEEPASVEYRQSFLGPIEPRCPFPLDIFGTRDEEKRICGFKWLQAHWKGSRNQCTVVSIGSRGSWKFEEALFKSSTCHIHTFDCTGDFPAPRQI